MSSSDINFKIYIDKLLKKVFPANGVTGSSLVCLDNVIKIVIEKIMKGVNQISLHTKKKTINYQDIQYAVNLFLPDEMAKKADAYALASLETYNKSKLEKEGKNVSKSALANLTFPVTRIQTYMMNISYASRKSEKASIYMTGICEFMIFEIITIAHFIAEENKKIRITPRHITLAIHQNTDMKDFYKNSVFSGGVVQYNGNQSELKK